MSQPKPSYTRDLEVLAELAEFGADLTSRFEEAWPVLSRLLVINDSSNAMIKSLKFSVHGMFQQIRFDSTLPAPSINTHNNYRRLEDCIKLGGMVKLLLTYPELNVLKSLTDIACDCYGAFTNTNPEMPPTLAPDLMIGRLSEIFEGLMLAAERLGVPLLSVGIRYSKLETLLRQYWAKRAEDEIKEAESTMPIPLFALPSEHQVKALTRAALVDLLASPEAATALKALGYATVGPTLPLPTLRGLVEALRAAASMPQPVANRVPNLRFDAKILEGIDHEAAEVLSSIVSQLNARGELYPDLCVEIPDPALPELLLTWTAKSAYNDVSLTEVRLHVEAHAPERSHYEPPEPVCLSLRDRAHKERLLCKVEIKDMILTAALLCRTVLGRQGFAISEVAAEPGTFAQLVKQSLQDTLRPQPDRFPGGAYAEGSDSEPTGYGPYFTAGKNVQSEPEPAFTNEPNVVKRIYSQILELKIKDLTLAHSPFEWPNGFLVEWRGWVEHSGTPHYIQVTPNSGVLGGPPGIHVNMIARSNGGPVQVGSMSCRPDLQDFLHATATLYAGALDQLGVNRATIKAPPGSFAQDVSTATPFGPWDDAPKKDGFDPLDYPPF